MPPCVQVGALVRRLQRKEITAVNSQCHVTSITRLSLVSVTIRETDSGEVFSNVLVLRFQRVRPVQPDLEYVTSKTIQWNNSHILTA